MPLRRDRYVLIAAVASSVFVAAPWASTGHVAADSGLAPVTQYWVTPGTHTWTVLPGITSITITASGAEGGRGWVATHPGGLGARETGTVKVQPGEQLQINVGGIGGTASTSPSPYPCMYIDGGAGGFNGGGGGGRSSASRYGAGGGGGGASDVRPAPFALQNRLVVGAGGGGSGGKHPDGYRDTTGGGGGGTEGGSGSPVQGASHGGRGGTQTSGGTPGSGYYTSQVPDPGSLGVGGNGLGFNGVCYYAGEAGGGGGGGYFGGGGAMWGGGGGGSSYGPPGSTADADANTGSGKVAITYTPPKEGPPVGIVLSPQIATRAPGGVQLYSVKALDAWGSLVQERTLPQLTITPDGPISPNGTCRGMSCSASQVGVYRITATVGKWASVGTLDVLSNGP